MRRILFTLALILIAAAPALIAPDAQARSDNEGFIYGRVVTDSGREYTGFLRWGDEEAFWDDLFHSMKEDMPFMELVEDEFDRDRDRERKRSRRISILKWVVDIEDDNWGGNRIFIARFGDIDEIRPSSGGAVLKMKTGSTYDVEGYANDVSSEIHVSDGSLGDIDLRWQRIDLIELLPVPRGAEPGVQRLYGKVETDAGDFEGFIQWDKEECLSIDELDGETRDGDVSIEFGKIRAIERRGSGGSLVTLKDGRELHLRGTNDVNDDNRGIMVEDARYGRVTVYWDAFDKVTFMDGKGSGRGYDEFKPKGELRGTVRTRDDDTYRGRIVIDLDESEDWEILNGSLRDIDMDIPLSMVKTISPKRWDESEVEFVGGEKLVLEEGQDVTENNDGVLVFTDGDRDPIYLEWNEIREIRLDH
ncbi:MAG: hypothetical protein JW819_09085 [Candidatus Krumholzibacteriota bacterium]|nr:hypothetical protein [Candidatus Krumholzibacteriota bacterium]